MQTQLFDPLNPPVAIAANILQSVLRHQPRRLAFAGPAGAGKSTLCEVIGGYNLDVRADQRWVIHPLIPIFNHADTMKEEVLEWVANARARALIPGEEATFQDFCNFLGLSPEIVKNDMWSLLGNVWEAMNYALEQVYEHKLTNVAEFAKYGSGEELGAKISLVEQHKPIFRWALQTYGQVIKELSADPTYWVNITVSRALEHPMCLNGDTRFAEEAAVLRGTGWTVVYVAVDPATQRQRRPEMTEAQFNHISEKGIGPDDCDYDVDGNQPLGKVLLDLAELLADKSVARVSLSC